MGTPYRGICRIVDDGRRPPRSPGAEAGTPPAPPGGDGLSHLAFPYRDTGEYLEHVLAFIGDGLGSVRPGAASGLGAHIMGGARRASRETPEAAHRRPSGGYREGAGAPPEAELPAPPATAEFIAYRSRLHPVRALVNGYAARAGLPAERCADLILAVSEVTANTLAHTAGGGTAHIWTSGREVICQVHDGGGITDPMAGGKRPAPDSDGAGV